MAGGTAIGMFFPLEKLGHLWVLAAFLCSLVFVYGYLFIKNDQKKIERNHKFFPNLRQVFKKDFDPIRGILTNRAMLFTCLIGIILSASFSTVINYTQIVTYVNLSHLNNSYTHGIVFILVLLVQSFSGYMMQKFTPPIFLLSLCILGIFITLLFSTISYLNVALWIILFFFLVSLEVSIFGKIHNKITDELRVTISSAMNMFSMILASFFSGFIYLGYTSISYIYTFFACIFFTIFVLIVFHNTIKQKETL